MRLIDADALANDMLFRCNQEITKYKTMRRALGDVGRAAFDSVKNAPTIDAEPVRHGRWGFLGMDMMAGSRAFYFGTCSECRERINFEAAHKNYCPNCGAKMDLEVPDGQDV